MMFPWLFPLGIGHWDYQAYRQSNVQNVSTNQSLSLKQYAKLTLCSADRRWGRDPAYLFFLADLLEKMNIHGFQRHVIPPSHVPYVNLDNLYQTNPDTGERFIREDRVTTIPHTIRSGHAYKRKAFLDMMARFRHFGDPQIFMTFSCDDFAPDMLKAVNSNKPWNDPVLFAMHFQHKWAHFFSTCVLKTWARRIGGIRHWAWVMEVQSRGSPHMHCLFWTQQSAEQLLQANIISASLPDPTDPLRPLVAKHQIHHHSPYCLRDNHSCRFGFPFAPCDEPVMENGRFKYTRTPESSMINPYSPFLLNIAKVTFALTPAHIFHHLIQYHYIL